MTEDILSILYQETIYYGGTDNYTADYYLYSINFDMKNGQPITGTGILDVNEKFVDDFRERSEKQNGESILEYYDDNTLMSYFNDEDHLILFYCPQGMEIGLNVDEGWVTVTYSDYEDYLRRI